MSQSVAMSDNPTTTSLEKPPASLAWLMWVLGALLFLIGFFHRIAFGVMAEPLTLEFGLTATTLGTLASFYYYSYTAMQVPVGVMADRFGPRKLLTSGALLAAIGTVIFALATNYWVISFGRLLIGGAVAVAFVTMMKISLHWFTLKRFALLTGLGLLAGNLGAVVAGAPLQEMLELFGWRNVMLTFAGITGLLALATGIWLRDDPTDLGYKSYGHTHDASAPKQSILSSLKETITYRTVFLLTLACGASAGSMLTFGGLWGVPYLKVAYGFSTSEAATIISVTLLVWAGCGVLLGHWSDATGKRKLPFIALALLAAAGWFVVTQIQGLPFVLLAFALFAAALGSCIMIVGLSWAKEAVPPKLQGTALGWCNTGVMIGPMVLQPLTGVLIDLNWSGATDSGQRVYDIAAFQAGFVPMMGWLILAAGLMLFAKEEKSEFK
ncbi:MFS transporter [Kiloniella antarctica]|uniref:Lysosomal dipeptide transporter MFSD1 n=1 Tax=Kiloniella antarctica TaxID=1550907 RepID=A0ABW5BT70_9PROT